MMLSPNRVFLPIGKTFLPGVKKPSHKKYSPATHSGQPKPRIPAERPDSRPGTVSVTGISVQFPALAGANTGRPERTKKAGKDQRPSRPWITIRYARSG